MKAIILAAGMGIRFRSQPKPLTKLWQTYMPPETETIMSRQVRQLIPVVGIDSILVVVGYKACMIMEEFPELLYVYNQNFAQTNTAKSLLLGLKKWQDDILWVNGDVYLEDGLLEKLVANGGSCALVSEGECDNEAVKYSIKLSGVIDLIGKELISFRGESLGANVITREHLPAFIHELFKLNDPAYFEAGLENMILYKHLQLSPVAIGKAYCKEIDTIPDLADVIKHISKN